MTIIPYAPHLAREVEYRGIRYYPARTPYAGRGRAEIFLDEIKIFFCISFREIRGWQGMNENELFDLVFGANECISEDGVKQKLCEPKAIAGLFNFKGRRRIEQLTSDGTLDAVLEKVDGHKVRRYDLIPTVQRYVQHLSDKAHGKSHSEKEMKLKEQKLEAEVALKESQGELHRLKTQIAAGEYISIDEVRLDYAKFFLVFKKFAMSIPARVCGMLSGQLEPLEVRRIEKEMAGEIADLLASFVIAGVVEPKEVKVIVDAEKNKGKEVAQEVPGQ